MRDGDGESVLLGMRDGEGSWALEVIWVHGLTPLWSLRVICGRGRRAARSSGGYGPLAFPRPPGGDCAPPRPSTPRLGHLEITVLWLFRRGDSIPIRRLQVIRGHPCTRTGAHRWRRAMRVPRRRRNARTPPLAWWSSQEFTSIPRFAPGRTSLRPNGLQGLSRSA